MIDLRHIRHLLVVASHSTVQAAADVIHLTRPALTKSIVSASRVSNAIADNNWALLEKVWSGSDPAGARIKRSVADALAADELVTALAATLKQAQADATVIITRPPSAPEPEPDPEPDPHPEKILKQDSFSGLSAFDANQLLDEIRSELNDGVTLDISYKIIGEEDA